jgi:hypothetical protein
MSQNLSQNFLAITRNNTDLEWLQGALAPLGQVVSAGGGSLDELLALVDVTLSSLVFVGLDREHLVAQCALIEGALEAKPMLAIVALGDGMDNQLVLNAMRAGARDFVAYGSRSSEVAGLVRRLGKRLPPVTPSNSPGRPDRAVRRAEQCRWGACSPTIWRKWCRKAASKRCCSTWDCRAATAWPCSVWRARFISVMPCAMYAASMRR